MKAKNILVISFIVSIVTIFIGAMFKIMHYANADALLIIGIASWLVLVITALYEIQNSTRINRTEKLMWTVGFILAAGVAAIIYLSIGRQKIIKEQSAQ